MKRIAIPALACLALAGSAALAQQAAPGATALDRWDSNHDGRVTLAEVRAGRARLFDGYDRNGDGFLGANELGQGAPLGGARRNAQGALRPWLDRNGDGVVSRREFVDGAAAWMQRMDNDGNGVLTTGDFGRRGGGRGGRWSNG